MRALTGFYIFICAINTWFLCAITGFLQALCDTLIYCSCVISLWAHLVYVNVQNRLFARVCVVQVIKLVHMSDGSKTQAVVAANSVNLKSPCLTTRETPGLLPWCRRMFGILAYWTYYDSEACYCERNLQSNHKWSVPPLMDEYVCMLTCKYNSIQPDTIDAGLRQWCQTLYCSNQSVQCYLLRRESLSLESCGLIVHSHCATIKL